MRSPISSARARTSFPCVCIAASRSCTHSSSPSNITLYMKNVLSNIQKEARKRALTSDERESMRLRLEGVIQAEHLTRGALAFSAESKAAWHATAAERRMEEVETLADRGALSPEVRSKLEANFEDHAQRIEGIVDGAEAGDPVRAADIPARFTSSLAAHASVITRVGDGSEDNETRRESNDFAKRISEREKKFARADRAVAVKTERDSSGETVVRTFAKTETAMSAPTRAIPADADGTSRCGHCR